MLPVEIEGVWQIDLPDPDRDRRVLELSIAPPPGYAGGGALRGPVTFEVAPGRMALGNWEDHGLAGYSGIVRYTADIERWTSMARARSGSTSATCAARRRSGSTASWPGRSWPRRGGWTSLSGSAPLASRCGSRSRSRTRSGPTSTTSARRRWSMPASASPACSARCGWCRCRNRVKNQSTGPSCGNPVDRFGGGEGEGGRKRWCGTLAFPFPNDRRCS